MNDPATIRIELAKDSWGFLSSLDIASNSGYLSTKFQQRGIEIMFEVFDIVGMFAPVWFAAQHDGVDVTRLGVTKDSVRDFPSKYIYKPKHSITIDSPFYQTSYNVYKSLPG